MCLLWTESSPGLRPLGQVREHYTAIGRRIERLAGDTKSLQVKKGEGGVITHVENSVTSVERKTVLHLLLSLSTVLVSRVGHPSVCLHECSWAEVLTAEKRKYQERRVVSSLLRRCKQGQGEAKGRGRPKLTPGSTNTMGNWSNSMHKEYTRTFHPTWLDPPVTARTLRVQGGCRSSTKVRWTCTACRTESSLAQGP